MMKCHLERKRTVPTLKVQDSSDKERPQSDMNVKIITPEIQIGGYSPPMLCVAMGPVTPRAI